MARGPLTNSTLLGTPGVIGVYNFTIANCSYFRNESVRWFYSVWPEPWFAYCCEDGTGQYSLFNFTYTQHGARLISRPYVDLGYVNHRLSPYWQHYIFFQVPQEQIVMDGVKCEYTDLHHLYMHRFWTMVMWNGAVTAVVIIGAIQLVVCLFVLIMWAYKKRTREQQKADMGRWWCTRARWEDWVSDVTHIFYVVCVGGCLIEATGHSSPIRWRSIIFYNAAVVYAWLTILSVLSTVLRQCAVVWFDEDEQEADRRARDENAVDDEAPAPARPRCRIINPEINHSRSLAQISDDWRWQRVFGQLAVFILIGTYLTFVDDDSGSAMDNIAALVFAALVVACMWSGGVGLVTTARTIVHIARFQN